MLPPSQRPERRPWRSPTLTALTDAASAGFLFRVGHDGFHQQGKHNRGPGAS